MMLGPSAVADLLAEAQRRSPRRCSEALAHLLRYRPHFQPQRERVAHGELSRAVLRVVRDNGPVRAGRIASELGRKPSEIANQLARLVEEGSIERVRHGVYE